MESSIESTALLGVQIPNLKVSCYGVTCLFAQTAFFVRQPLGSEISASNHGEAQFRPDMFSRLLRSSFRKL